MDREKDDQCDEQRAFLESPTESEAAVPHRKRPAGERIRWHLRWVIEALMAVCIVVLLACLLSSREAEKKSPVPKLPKKVYTFSENHRYLNEDMFFNETDTLHTLHNWIELSSSSRGFVQFPDADAYSLPEPYIAPVDRTSDGPAYMVSVYHQLHCLSYLVQHFQAGYGGTELSREVAHHSAHCFDYLRQALMCAADSTLEGETEFGPGWGSEHTCTDYDALLAWANDHATMAWRGNLPDEATL